jgi:coenzyme F420-0:L-glutamate ligase/coenzyme F420-1:gamma-L-glutamate ligase
MQPFNSSDSPPNWDFSPNSLWEVLKSRRSIRVYRNEPVEVALVTQLLAVAAQAPSAHNRQPWRWAVVATAERRRDLAAQMGVEFARDLKRDGVNDDTINSMVARSRRRIGEAPMLVVPCLTMADMDVYPDPMRQQAEWTMAMQSVALACQNLMLAAQAVGLGSCWICAPLFCAPTVQQALDLPTEWQPQALITLGYPADAGRIRPRRPVEDVTVYR